MIEHGGAIAGALRWVIVNRRSRIATGIRVFERAGFTREACGEPRTTAAGGWQDGILFGRVAED